MFQFLFDCSEFFIEANYSFAAWFSRPGNHSQVCCNRFPARGNVGLIDLFVKHLDFGSRPIQVKAKVIDTAELRHACGSPPTGFSFQVYQSRQKQKWHRNGSDLNHISNALSRAGLEPATHWLNPVALELLYIRP